MTEDRKELSLDTMSEQKHSVQSCSNIWDFGEVKPNDASLGSENLGWHAFIYFFFFLKGKKV